MPKKPNLTLQTTTLWDYPSQHYGKEMQGDKDYKGATPSYVIWNLLQRYTKPGEIVLDPMCGSGTTIDVAKDCQRQGVGFDLNPYREDIMAADAREIPLEDNSVDFVFVDPPYSNHIEYSKDPRCIGNLDAKTDAYYDAMTEVIEEIFRVLKNGRYFGLYVSDSHKKGQPLCPIGFGLFYIMCNYFIPQDIIAVTRHNKTLFRNHWHTSAIEGNYFLRGFNYLFIMKKSMPEAAPSTRVRQRQRQQAKKQKRKTRI